jgi:GxxExxY protein
VGLELAEYTAITRICNGAAIAVHKALGPGLLESAYEECLCAELQDLALPFARQKPLPVVYKGRELDCGYRLDIVVRDLIVIEIKSVATLLPLHEAQLLTYLKLGQYKVGLLYNFNVPVMKDGIRRLLNGKFNREETSQKTSDPL